MSGLQGRSFIRPITLGRFPKRRIFGGRKVRRSRRVYRPHGVMATQRPLSTRRTGTVRGTPFPQKLRTRLTALDREGLISASTAVHSRVYRPTSYFDFDPAVGGQTFGGYNNLASLYDRYRVLAWRAVVTFTNLETTSVTVSLEAIADTSTPGSGTATDYTEYAVESGNWSKYCTLAPNGSGGSTKTLTLYANCYKIWGTPEVYNDSIFAANAGASPSANTWLRIAGYKNDLSSMATGVQFTMKLTSFGYWDEKNDLVV